MARLGEIAMDEDERKEKIFTESAGSDIGVRADKTTKFHQSRGHGFAAEQANTVKDQLLGHDAHVVGDDNALNGADRIVDGIRLQSKYCKTPNASINSTFDRKTGKYRYLNENGYPMPVEVPADQYDKCVRQMAKKIQEGKVPRIKDPNRAPDLVRKGRVTYEQAVNISKGGNIDALIYDAETGAVICRNAFGLSFVVTFALSCWNGDDLSTATENALVTGIQVYGTTFVIHVFTQELARTGIVNPIQNAIAPLSESMAGSNSQVMQRLLKSCARQLGVDQLGAKGLGRLLASNAVADIVIVLVLSGKDVVNVFRRRISGSQFIKDFIITVGGVAGGAAGSAVGDMAGGSLGRLAGSAIGTAIGGTAAKAAADAHIEDDAVKMGRVIETSLVRFAKANALTPEEDNLISEDIDQSLTTEVLMQMQASSDREAFADKIVESAGNKIIGFRSLVQIPDSRELVEGLEKLGEDYQLQEGIFKDLKGQSAVDVGEKATGTDYSAHAAKMARYAARQSHGSSGRIASDLRNMEESNRQANEMLRNTSQQIYEARQQKKAEDAKTDEELDALDQDIESERQSFLRMLNAGEEVSQDE